MFPWLCFLRYDYYRYTTERVKLLSVRGVHLLNNLLLVQVFTCGDNSSFCCGHKDTGRPIFRPRFVEALKGIPCQQVRAIFCILR